MNMNQIYHWNNPFLPFPYSPFSARVLCTTEFAVLHHNILHFLKTFECTRTFMFHIHNTSVIPMLPPVSHHTRYENQVHTCAHSRQRQKQCKTAMYVQISFHAYINGMFSRYVHPYSRWENITQKPSTTWANLSCFEKKQRKQWMWSWWGYEIRYEVLLTNVDAVSGVLLSWTIFAASAFGTRERERKKGLICLISIIISHMCMCECVCVYLTEPLQA